MPQTIPQTEQNHLAFYKKKPHVHTYWQLPNNPSRIFLFLVWKRLIWICLIECVVMVVHWAGFVSFGFRLWRVWMKCVRLILFRFAEVANNRKYINYLHKCKKRRRRKMEIYLTKRQTDGSFIICMYIYMISVSVFQIFLLIFFSFIFNRFFSNLKWWGVN